MLMRCRSRADLVGRRLDELSAPEQKDGSPTAEAARRMAEFESRNSKFVWKARRFDGTEVTLEGNATAIERDGETVIVLVARAAGERKEAEDALLESAAGLGSFFERNADAMSFFDPQTLRYIETNEAVARLIGAPGREALRNTSPVERWPERQPDGRLSIRCARSSARLAPAAGHDGYVAALGRHHRNQPPATRHCHRSRHHAAQAGRSRIAPDAGQREGVGTIAEAVGPRNLTSQSAREISRLRKPLRMEWNLK